MRHIQQRLDIKFLYLSNQRESQEFCLMFNTIHSCISKCPDFCDYMEIIQDTGLENTHSTVDNSYTS